MDTVTREQLMAYRILTSGLERGATSASALPIWDVGVQDRDGSATVVLAARLERAELDRWLESEPLGEPGRRSEFALAWSLRGSPHLHRRHDLQDVADALWPRDEKDALARLVGSGKTLVGNGSTGLDGYREVADAMSSVVTSTMRKPEASAALTAALPNEFSAFCAPCDSVHVMEMLFRCAALPGGIGLVPGQPATMEPLKPTVKRPSAQRGLGGFVAAYLRLYGAATPAEVGAHFGTTATQLKPDWPETVPLTVAGTKLATTPDLAATIRDVDLTSATSLTRLLPPGDPLLQPRDRNLLIEDKAAWKVLWPSINPAGVVLAGGAFAGWWRPKKSGSKLTLTVTGFRKLTAAERKSVAAEAEVVGTARGAADLEVVFA